MARYKYSPIDLEGPLLRLVRLFKGSFPDDIQCEIFLAWLHGYEKCMPYEALSYTWGSTERTSEITTNDCTLAVTENLHHALRYLRYEYTDRILWIDLICINQDDFQERSHQVAQMRDIYKEAEQVLIWLGLPTYNTSLSMDSMRGYQQRHGIQGNGVPQANLWIDTWLRSNSKEHPQSNGLKELLSRPWFRRIWVLQEVANCRPEVRAQVKRRKLV
jgi:hypothetical protein